MSNRDEALMQNVDKTQRLIEKVRSKEATRQHELDEPDFVTPGPFEVELRDLLNKHGIDNETDTPDFVLAHWIVRQLRAYRCILQDREDQRRAKG